MTGGNLVVDGRLDGVVRVITRVDPVDDKRESLVTVPYWVLMND